MINRVPVGECNYSLLYEQVNIRASTNVVVLVSLVKQHSNVLLQGYRLSALARHVLGADLSAPDCGSALLRPCQGRRG